MNQSTFIFGSLFIAFLVFITAKGRLGLYLSLLNGSAKPDSAGGASPTIPGNQLPSIGGLPSPPATLGLPAPGIAVSP
jgi:hypothetical protein